MLKLFLSRDQPGDELAALRDQKVIELECKACIRLHALEVAPPPAADWLFFLSPSGVELFAPRYSAAGFQISALWRGTAEAVRRRLGREPDFTGHSEDSEEAIREFVGRLGPKETVTVAQGELSRRRFRGLLPESRLREWTFYSNEPDPPPIPSEADYLLFTSPSNAEAYLSRHKRGADQRVVAIGRTTFGRLRELGHGDALLSEEPSEKGLWEAVVRDVR